MKSKTRMVLLCMAVAALLVQACWAQAATSRKPAGWGLRGGISADPDQVFFGTHFDVGYIAGDLGFRPNATLGFGDDVTLLSINPDLLYNFRVPDVGHLYAGGILAFQVAFVDGESDSEVGLHALTGLELESTPLFLEIAIGLDDAPDLKATIGYTFSLR